MAARLESQKQESHEKLSILLEPTRAIPPDDDAAMDSRGGGGDRTDDRRRCPAHQTAPRLLPDSGPVASQRGGPSMARGTALKSRFGSISGMSPEIGQLYRDYDRMMERANHHAAMALRYELAPRYRWLLVEPGPPDPE